MMWKIDIDNTGMFEYLNFRKPLSAGNKDAMSNPYKLRFRAVSSRKDPVGTQILVEGYVTHDFDREAPLEWVEGVFWKDAVKCGATSLQISMVGMWKTIKEISTALQLILESEL